MMVKPRKPPWDYVPRGPFTLGWAIAGRPVHAGKLYVNLEDAIGEMAESLPPRNGETMFILDDGHTTIIGFSRGSTGYHAAWQGCDAAFKILYAVFDPLEVAFYEMIAHGDFEDLTT